MEEGQQIADPQVLHPQCMMTSVQACGGSVMNWGCIGWLGPGVMSPKNGIT